LGKEEEQPPRRQERQGFGRLPFDLFLILATLASLREKSFRIPDGYALTPTFSNPSSINSVTWRFPPDITPTAPATLLLENHDAGPLTQSNPQADSLQQLTPEIGFVLHFRSRTLRPVDQSRRQSPKPIRNPNPLIHLPPKMALFLQIRFPPLDAPPCEAQ